MTHVVIFLPGIMGSELSLDGDVIWPGSALEVILPYKKMKELMSDDLEVTGIIRSVFPTNQYQSLMDDLVACGFDEATHPPTLYPCPYDWRRDNKLSAETLAGVVEKAVADHGAGTEISLIGHSMGGLVARHYLESGKFSARPGYGAVKRLITLGTPHRGAPIALCAAMGNEPRMFLNAQQVKQMADDPRFPSLYQLLPPQHEPFAWDAAARAEYGSVDIYDAGIATALGLSAANLASASAFHSTLDPARKPAATRYFFFVGTRQVTLSNVSLLKSGPSYHLERIELEDAGDGTVPVWSGGITSIQSQPVGGEHGTIYKNDDLRRTLAVLLGKAGVLAAAPGAVEVSLRDRVVGPGAPLHVALTFGAGTGKVEGELRWERAQFDSASNLTGYLAFQAPMPISYSGLDAEKINLRLVAPNFAGVYRLVYVQDGSVEPSGADDLFVQKGHGTGT